MPPLAIIAAVGVGIAAVGTVASISAQKKQVKLQKQAIKAQRAQDNLRAARDRREAIRNARLATGVVAQNAANQGVSGSSAALGSIGSIEQQLNQGLSFLDTTNRLADQATELIGRANVQGAKAASWDKVAGFGMSVFSNASGLSKVFGGGSSGG